MKYSITAIVLLSLVVTWGCSTEPEVDPAIPADQSLDLPADSQTPLPPPIPDRFPPGAVRSTGPAAGELAEVDATGGTFQLLTDDGASSTFRFSESTEVTGADGTQGLATRAGSRVIVNYDESTDPPTATSIEIVP